MFLTIFSIFLQISDQVSIIYEETLREDRLVIDFELRSEPLSLVAYIEDCRMKLWDNAFPTFFRGHDALNKLTNLRTPAGQTWLWEKYFFGEILPFSTKILSFGILISMFFYNVFNNELIFTRMYFKYELLAKGAIRKKTFPSLSLHGLTGWTQRACFRQINSGRGLPRISQGVDGTLTELLVLLPPLKLNIENLGKQWENLVLKWLICNA